MRLETLPAFKRNVVDSAFAAVSAVSLIDRKTLLDPCRFQHVVRARHVAFFLAHEAGAAFYRIGKRASRDRTTVRHGVLRVRERLGSDQGLLDLVDAARGRMQ